MSQTMLIAGGGTGGHLFPGLAVARALKEMRPGLELAFVGSGKALEGELLSQEGFTLERLSARAFVGQGIWGQARSLAALLGAVWSARGILSRYKPGLVLAVGGYAALPLGLAAFMSGVPVAVQEQNAAPGLTNRVLARFSRMVFTSFPSGDVGLPPDKINFTGNPVRPELLSAAQQAAAARPDPRERFNLLILGGSQGATSLNRALSQALPLLAERRDRLAITHQTGPRDLAEVREAYAQAGFKAEVGAFFSDMGRLYGQAHLVFCRAGAGTLTEICALGRPAVCVPYPFAAGDHQTKNAQSLVQAGAARLIPDRELDGPKAAGIIAELMDTPAKLADMESRAKSLGRPRAAWDIAGRCLALMNGKA